MRLSLIPLLALIVAGAGGCATGSQPRYPAPQGYANPGQWVPLAQPGPSPSPWSPAAQQPGFFPLQPIFRPVNVPALLALQGRVPCAPREVAPGTWATFDCGPFQALSRAIQYIPFVRFNFLPAGPLPASVDHRADGSEGPIKDQGAVGDCTAVSLSTAMDNAVRRMGRRDVISALHVWSRYGVPITGKAGDSNLDKAVAVEETWQYDPVKACKLVRSPMDTCTTAYGVSSGSEAFDPSLKAEHASADASGRYKLTAVEQLHAKPADINEIAGVLATGDDVWISFTVNDQAWMERSLQNAVIPDYDTVEDTGHAVTLAGYRTLSNGTKQFLIHNSWSARWGDNGYGWISEAMVAKFTRAAYHVRVADSGGGGAPGSKPQTPGQPPAGDDCPAGQVKEPVFGTCIPGGIPGGIPGLPGFPSGSQAPAPSAPPAQGGCPAGQAPDMMTRQCAGLCAGGAPSVGGMCLPLPH
jgi:Papain family cysteine protease